jgi:predicted phosphodiesterase
VKIVVVSDIHANLDAFRAVLDAERGFDGFLCLGDLTGYGTEPVECLELARSVARKAAWSLVLAGNHDAVLTGKLAESWFNRAVLPSIAYTRARLSLRDLDWLASLPFAADVILPRAPDPSSGRKPLFPFLRKGAVAAIAAHGDPAEPLTGYLWGGEETADAYGAMEKRGVGLCFVGHSHEASAFSRGGFGVVSPAGVLSVAENEPAIVNPGSVGFPRDFGLLARITSDEASGAGSSPSTDGLPDGEPLSLERFPAYYALWDADAGTVSFRNARYDRSAFERRVTAAGL